MRGRQRLAPGRHACGCDGNGPALSYRAAADARRYASHDRRAGQASERPPYGRPGQIQMCVRLSAHVG